jgi:large subunit ribosomal protein L31
MKAAIHPNYTTDAKITCACGATYSVGSTMAAISIELCSACHPFYTGQMKYLDTAGRVDAFKTRMDKAKSKVVSKADRRKMKRQQRIERDLERPDSLSELRSDKKN